MVLAVEVGVVGSSSWLFGVYGHGDGAGGGQLGVVCIVGILHLFIIWREWSGQM